MKPHQSRFLDLALDRQVLRFGQFTLKSGRTSPYFFNAGLFDSGAALATLGECYADALQASARNSSEWFISTAPGQDLQRRKATLHVLVDRVGDAVAATCARACAFPAPAATASGATCPLLSSGHSGDPPAREPDSPG